MTASERDQEFLEAYQAAREEAHRKAMMAHPPLDSPPGLLGFVAALTMGAVLAALDIIAADGTGAAEATGYLITILAGVIAWAVASMINARRKEERDHFIDRECASWLHRTFQRHVQATESSSPWAKT